MLFLRCELMNYDKLQYTCFTFLYLIIYGRSGDGELRLGVRRTEQAKSGTPYLAPFSQHMNINGIADVVNAISTKGVFHICYNPRY